MGAGIAIFSKTNRTPNAIGLEYRSEAVGSKVHSREGNSPDRQLRFLIYAKCAMRCDRIDNREVGLEAAIP